MTNNESQRIGKPTASTSAINWDYGEINYIETDTSEVPPGPLPVQPPGCHTYWGSHGCNKEAGHEGHHLCDCCDCENHPDIDPDFGYPTCVGAYPYYGPETNFYH